MRKERGELGKIYYVKNVTGIERIITYGQLCESLQMHFKVTVVNFKAGDSLTDVSGLLSAGLWLSYAIYSTLVGVKTGELVHTSQSQEAVW